MCSVFIYERHTKIVKARLECRENMFDRNRVRKRNRNMSRIVRKRRED
jgi:hypothetical protein